MTGLNYNPNGVWIITSECSYIIKMIDTKNQTFEIRMNGSHQKQAYHQKTSRIAKKPFILMNSSPRPVIQYDTSQIAGAIQKPDIQKNGSQK
jgi:hypothetical protein